MKTKTTKKPWAVANIDHDAIRELQRLVAEGEGLHLEFKRKAAYPEKIVRELVAFANTNGGTLLIGVDDNGTILGIKYPDEEVHVVVNALKQLCRPAILYHESIITLSENRFIVRIDVPQSNKRPHYLITNPAEPECIVRYEDKSVKASREMKEIVSRSKKKKDIKFTVGEHETSLIKFLDEHKAITFAEFRTLTGLNRFKASRKLILLVLANVLKIKPTEKGDLYSRN